MDPSINKSNQISTSPKHSVEDLTLKKHSVVEDQRRGEEEDDSLGGRVVPGEDPPEDGVDPLLCVVEGAEAAQRVLQQVRHGQRAELLLHCSPSASQQLLNQPAAADRSLMAGTGRDGGFCAVHALYERAAAWLP